MKALVGAFNQEKALVGAFSVIVKTGCGTDGALHSTSPNFMWQEVVARDLLCMGVQVVSFTLKDVSDDVDYLSSLGRWAPICHEVDTIT